MSTVEEPYGTKYPDLFQRLAAPFDPSEVKSRVQGGKPLYYITARTAMNRLDTVVGPENWWDEYEPHENSVLCRLSIRLPDNSKLTKCDAGGYAGMADSGDDDKSGYSDAFKRAAVKLGVGRYLYRDGVPHLGHSDPADPADDQNVSTDPEPPSEDRPKAPGSGKGLFAACKELEQKLETSVVKPLNDWAKTKNLPGRMVDWTPEQVSQAWDYVVTRWLTQAHVAKANATPPASRPAAHASDRSYSGSTPSTSNGADLTTLRRDLYARCHEAAVLSYGIPNPSDAQVKTELAAIAHIHSPGLVIESIKALSDPAEIKGLLDAGTKRLEEISDIPF